MAQGRLYVIALRVGRPAERVWIKPGLAGMQEFVGGYIEAVGIEGFPDRLTLMCNEEGKLKGLPPNRMIPGDVLVGDCFVTRMDAEGESVDVTESDLKTVRSVFPDFQYA